MKHLDEMKPRGFINALKDCRKIRIFIIVCAIAKLIIDTRSAKRHKKAYQASSNRDNEFIGVQAYVYVDESQGEEEVQNMFTLL